MARAQHVQFRAGDQLEVQLVARGAREDDGPSAGNVARRDLQRYYHCLAETFETIALTEAEASLVVDACNGILFESWSVSLLSAIVDNAIRLEGLADKWGVDGPALLVERLRGLSYCQSLTLVDAVERYWQAPDGEALRRVGLGDDDAKRNG
jgi:hypothetical protein